jgi:glycosyltransferase involved in cell wall biosynthesis
MRILFLTSVDHPQVRMEAEALRQICDVKYVPMKFKGLRKGLRSLLTNIPRLSVALIKLHIPPAPIGLFLYSLLISSSILDDLNCENEKYDIIYAHWLFPAGLIGLIISKTLGSKVVSAVWGYDIQVVPGVKDYGIGGVNRIASKYVLIKSDVVIVNHRIHQKAVEKFLGNSNDRIKGRVIYVPPAIPDVSLNILKDLTDEIEGKLPPFDVLRKLKVVLYCPSLRSHYGIMEFLKAAQEVLIKVRDCIFIVVGEGELMDKAVRFTEEKGIKDNVIFTGRVSFESMKALYRLSTLVCDLAYPGTGTSTLEAFCFGKPVIGIKSPKTVVKDGVNGFVINRGDYKTLAQRIINILQNPELGEKLSSNARKTFEENFHIQKRISALSEIFSSMVR